MTSDIYAIVKNDSKTGNWFQLTNEISVGSILQNDTIIPPEDDDFIEESIIYDAVDSTIFDAVNQVVYLYGGAKVQYGKMELKAAYIEYNFQTYIAKAAGVPDSTGNLVNTPIFTDDGQIVEQESLEFNFNSKAGYSKSSFTTDGDAIVHSNISKIQPNKWVHIKNGKFTTCDAENPHYHFHLTKAIAIPDDKIVTGPIYLKVRKVPLPVALPFGFFPNKKESTHGILLPGYGDGGDLGFFLQQGGYYIPINDHWDTKILADIYSRGSWSVSNKTNYKKKYKYNGSFTISNSIFKRGIPEIGTFSKERNFFVDWFHFQDPKAKPNTSFDADVKFGSINNFANNLSSSQGDFLQGTFNSSVNWTKASANKPLNFSISAREVQNQSTRNFRITLPSMSMSSGSSLAEFVSSDKFNSSKWYNKVKYTFRTDFEHNIEAEESEMRLNNINNLLGNANSGIRSRVDLTTNRKIFDKLVSVTPRVTYTEYWSLKRYQEALDPENLNLAVADTVSDFMRTGDVSLGATMTTKFYGMFKFKRSENINAIRHVLTPRLSFNYTPESVRSVAYGFDSLGVEQRFNPWLTSAYRASDITERGGVSVGLQNNLEMKIRDKSQLKPTWKKVKLLDNLNINSGYNFIADSLNMDPVTTNFATTILRKFNVYGGAGFEPYDRDSTGRRIDTYLWDSQDKLLRLTNANISASWSLASKKNKGGKKTDNATDADLEYVNQNANQFVDFSVPWSLNLTYSVDLFKSYDRAIQADTNVVTSSILFNGDFTIFEKWMISFSSGYDLVNKDFTNTFIDLYWDLHCWELKFHWVPIGIRKSYSVQLNIKSTLLKDLKLQRRGNYGEPRFF